MKIKYLIGLCLMALFLMSMSCASASEDANQTLSSEILSTDLSDGAISVSNDDEILTESGQLYVNASAADDGEGTKEMPYNTFQKALSEARDGDSIYVAGGEVYKGLGINVNLTIDKQLNLLKYGDGEAVFDAERNSRIFNVTSSCINITGLTFVNGNATNGGAILFENSILNSNINATYVNNTAIGCGGANYFSSVFYSNITGTYVNNAAMSKGAYVNRGGAIYIDGGSYSNVAGTYVNNTAADEGDAIFLSGVENLKITGTYINHTSMRDYGIIRFSSISTSLNISNAVFLNNSGILISSAHGLTADNNWFGNNATNYDERPNTQGIEIKSWLFLTGESNDDTVKFFLMSYDSETKKTAAYDNTLLPEVNLTLTATNTTLDKGYASLGEEIGHSYSINASVTAQVENVCYAAEIKKGDFDFLQELINNASENSVINLERNYTYSDLDTMTSGVFINKNVRINGNGFTIDAKGKSRIFNVTAGSLNLSDVALKNGYADNGGAIYFAGALSGSVINATFINNTATASAGAIFFAGEVFDSAMDSTFINNTAKIYGGANRFMRLVSNLTLTGTYAGNKAVQCGGANSFSRLSNSTVTGNYVNNTAGEGGANYFASFVSNSTLNGTYSCNNATSNFRGINCIPSISNSCITGTYIKNNAEGGALIYINKNDDSRIENAIFLNNIYTFAIRLSIGSMTADNIWFGNNASNRDQKPFCPNVEIKSWLFLTGECDPDKARFFLMSYDGTTASAYDNSLMPEVNLTMTAANTVLDKGYALLDEEIGHSYSANADVTAQVENACYTAEIRIGEFDLLQELINNASENSVINLEHNYTYNEFDTITEGVVIDRNVTINGNGFTIDAKGKSRIFNVTAESLNISNVTLKNGHADNGGAIYFASAIYNSSISATYINNTAERSGGANYFNMVSYSVVEGNYVNNTEKHTILDTVGGGANYFNTVLNSTVGGTYVNNSADYYGGANFFNKVLNSTVGGTYVSNSADYYGGANYFNVEVLFSAVCGTYVSNSAKGASLGGGANYFFIVWNSTVAGTYVNNTAYCGGANSFYLRALNSNITGIYINNTAKQGIIFFIDSSKDTNISNAIFLNNNGTVIYVSDDITADNNWFGNNASNYDERPNTHGVEISRWLFLNATANPDSIAISEISNITFKLFSYSNSTGISSYDNSKLPIVNLTLTATKGEVENVTNPDKSVEYLATEFGSGSVTARIENVECTVWINNDLINSSISAEDVVLVIANSTAINPVTLPEGLNVTYTIDDDTIANVTPEGIVTGLRAGNTTITISIVEDGIHFANSTVINVGVNKIPTQIALENDNVSLKVNENLSSGAALIPAEAGNLTYASSDDSIAVVENGQIIAVGEGKAIITVSFNGNDTYAAAENRTVEVTVSLNDAGISVENDTLDLFVDDVVVINASTTPEDLKISYTSDNPDVAAVDENGTVTAIGEGVAVITLGVGDGVVFARNSTNVTVIVSKIPAEIIVLSDSLELKVFEGSGHFANLTPGDAGILNYSSSDESVAYVMFGSIVAAGEGTAVITVSFAGNEKYAAAENRTVTVTVTLWDASVSVENDTLGLFVGENSTIVATTSPDGLTVNYTSSDESVVTVDENGTVTAVGEGAAVITLSVGNGQFFAYNSTNVTVTVSKIPTEIIVLSDVLDLKVLEGAGYFADLVPGDAGALNYVSSNESVAMIILDSFVLACGEGTAVITVSFAGNEKYAAAENKTVKVRVTLWDASVSVDNDTLDLFVDDTYSINATTNPVGLIIDYVSSDTSVATVDGNGTVTAVGEGVAVITLGVGDGEGLARNSTNVTVTVSKIPTEIEVNSPVGEMSAGAMGHVAAELIPSDAGKLSYVSNDTGVVSVSSTGVIKANKAGTALITVSFAGNDKYAAAESKTINVKVILKDSSVTVDEDSLDLFVDDTYSINAAAVPGDLVINYASSDESVALVDENGTVTAVGEGAAVITLTVGDGEVFAYNSTNVTVTVSKIPTEIDVLSDVLDLKVLEGAGYFADLVPGDAGALNYVSSDESVAMIILDSFVLASGKGTAVITVSFAGNEKYAAAENKTVEVRVSLWDASVSVDNDTLDLFVDDTYSINATKNPDSILLDIAYTSSDESVAVVDENGTVTAVGEGVAVITLSVGDGEGFAYNSTNVTVTVSKIPTEIRMANESISLKVWDFAPIGATLTPEGAGNLTYLSSDANVADVMYGAIIAVGEGEANITVSFAGNDKYAASESRTINVKVSLKDSGVKVDNDTLDLFVGESHIINATATPEALAINYASSDESVVRVDENGTVTAVSEGSAVITLSVGDGEVFAFNSTDVTVTVSRIPSDISMDTFDIKVTDIDATIVKIHLPLRATGNVAVTINGETSVIEISSGTVYTILGGLVMPLHNDGIPAGEYSVSATYNGDYRYEPSTADGTFTVSKIECDVNIAQDASVVTVEVPEDATGNIVLIIGDETFVSPIEKGTASFDLSDVPSGDYNATVSYGGDGIYNGFEVVRPIFLGDKFVIAASDLTKYYHGSERFVANITDAKGNPVASATVGITVNGLVYVRVTDENGSVSIAVNLNSGEYPVSVAYEGISVNATVTVLATVSGDDLVKVFRNATQYYAAFRDSEGNYLPDGTVVKFNVHGVMYERKVSGNNGLAKLNINLEQGEYVITAINPVTGENAANNITVISRLVENRDITKYYRNATQYTVKVMGDDGKPVGAGVTVKFNINGVLYKRTTDKSGMAKLNINLNPGNYIITAEYKGCRVSNKIKVLPILSARDLTKKYGSKDPFVATLVDGQGKAFAEQKIKFNINGVFYYRTTNSKGQAELNVNLVPGKYIVTSSYNSANISNRITITL